MPDRVMPTTEANSLDPVRIGGGALDYGNFGVVVSTLNGNSARRGGAIEIDQGDFFLRSTTPVPPASRRGGAAGPMLRLNKRPFPA
jgi:hypothetical protein